MATSNAATPDQYVAEIEDPARRELVTKLREFIAERLPDGYVEQMGFGMPGWVVPMEQTGPTYNGQPLGVVGIANQKQYVAVYLMAVYFDPDLGGEFERRWRESGKRFDMGKSCLRLRREDDVAWDALEFAVAAVGPDDLVAAHESVHGKG
jgi:hypothetical protein